VIRRPQPGALNGGSDGVYVLPLQAIQLCLSGRLTPGLLFPGPLRRRLLQALFLRRQGRLSACLLGLAFLFQASLTLRLRLTSSLFFGLTARLFLATLFLLALALGLGLTLGLLLSTLLGLGRCLCLAATFCLGLLPGLLLTAGLFLALLLGLGLAPRLFLATSLGLGLALAFGLHALTFRLALLLLDTIKGPCIHHHGIDHLHGLGVGHRDLHGGILAMGRELKAHQHQQQEGQMHTRHGTEYAGMRFKRLPHHV